MRPFFIFLPFKNWTFTIRKPNKMATIFFLPFEIQTLKRWFSNGFGFWVFGIRATAILICKLDARIQETFKCIQFQMNIEKSVPISSHVLNIGLVFKPWFWIPKEYSQTGHNFTIPIRDVFGIQIPIKLDKLKCFVFAIKFDEGFFQLFISQ